MSILSFLREPTRGYSGLLGVTRGYSGLLGVTRGYPSHLFGGYFFDPFLESLFFASWATFGRPRWPKASQNEAKMDPKGYLKALPGKCKNYGRHYTGGNWEGLGEAPGGDFFQAGSQDPPWRRPGQHFYRFNVIWGALGGANGVPFSPGYAIQDNCRWVLRTNWPAKSCQKGNKFIFCAQGPSQGLQNWSQGPKKGSPGLPE